MNTNLVQCAHFGCPSITSGTLEHAVGWGTVDDAHYCGAHYPKHALDEALEVLADVIGQACEDPDTGYTELDSMALSAYADGMRLLAKHGRLIITHEAYRRVIGHWPTPASEGEKADCAYPRCAYSAEINSRNYQDWIEIDNRHYCPVHAAAGKKNPA